ncbi:MAG TPA: hypothetical protein VMV18_12770 [bacterium]|nr:hypothetical protein [bacterium]
MRTSNARRLAASLILLAASAACHENKKFDPTAGLPDCGTDAPFTVAPLADASIRGLNPLGNLNPPGHTFPTDHMYLYLAITGTTGVADIAPITVPGDGRIVSLTASQHLSASPVFTDWGLVFMPCKQLQINFGHVATLSSAIMAALGGNIPDSNCQTYSTGGQEFKNCYEQTKIDLHAGDPLGTAGGNPGQLALDMGAFDSRITPLVWADPTLTRQSPDGFDDFHVVCPVDYFAAGPKAALEARIGSFDGSTPRTVPPICGTVDQDVVGTAQGRWFVPGTTSLSPEDPHLALVHDNVDPTFGTFSAGTTTSAFNGTFHFTPATTGNVNLDFNLVTPAAGMVCYDVTVGSGGAGGTPAGSVLVQMSSPTDLKIGRVASPCGTGPWTFTAGAKSFVR